ncbi:hypothetical protein [Saccharopolyspora sp. ASAGF58]|uniref:hypothetical protein n=1 Tax=Saccharopolyspora sp. ASAGF58 TaxID=2719023 RepID=UPI0014401851|nr:hypothetical protein [Saccharopolyspora sp. ASAGF58]QIZ37824.1 hypothetical protein FDZ84_28675 [Saccharopolyspora sp. ASAGF58]
MPKYKLNRTTTTGPNIRDAIQDVVDYNWASERADYEQQDAEDRQRHIFRALSTIAEWLDRSRPKDPGSIASPAATDPQDPGRPGGYSGSIEWDLVENDDPRRAAEELWELIKNSPGPIVDLVADNGARIQVDLALEPGQGDVKPVTGNRSVILSGISSAFTTPDDSSASCAQRPKQRAETSTTSVLARTNSRSRRTPCCFRSSRHADDRICHRRRNLRPPRMALSPNPPMILGNGSVARGRDALLTWDD